MNTSPTLKISPIAKQPITLSYHDREDSIKFFCVYLEFIIDWIKMDIENYHYLISISQPKEVEFFQKILTQKIQMLSLFTVYRVSDYSEQFGFSRTSAVQQSVGCQSSVHHSSPIKNTKHAFAVAFQKENKTLDIFEKANRPNLEATIKALLEIAISEQRHVVGMLKGIIADNGWDNAHVFAASVEELVCPSFL